MKKISLMLASIFTLLSFNLSAKDEYQGMISSTIVEPNGYVYMGDEGFDNGGVFTDKQIIYFTQERGQKLTMSKQNIVFDTSRDKKYHLILEIIERKGEKFKAKVSFYQNAMGHAGSHGSTVGSSALISKVIIIILGILSGVFINRFLGPSLKGEYIFLLNTINFFAIFLNLGIY